MDKPIRMIWQRAVSDEYAGRTFFLFISLHVVMWSLVPGLTRHELDSDSMMHFAWGQEWQWSYSLHPPLVPWVVAGFLKIFGINNLSYVVLSQVNIALALTAIWFLARQFFSARVALAAVCLLEFIPYYSFLSQRFNHSALLISLWALTTLFAYFALHRQRLSDWVGLSLLAMASMLCKYYSVTLLVAIGLVFVLTARGRATWRTRGPYIAVTLFLVVMALHAQHVILNKVGTIEHIGDYFNFSSFAWRWPPVKFFLAQLVYALPAFIVFVLATRDDQSRHRWYHLFKSVSWQGSHALIYMVTLFPLLATTVPGLLLGVDISSRWGRPMLGMVGLLLIFQYPARLSVVHCRRVVAAAFVWVMLLPIAILTAHGLGWVTDEANSFPGKELAGTITKSWHTAYGVPLRLVTGGWVAPDSIAFHSPDHPSVLQHLNFKRSPWVEPAGIDEHGIAVVCLLTDAVCLEKGTKRFPGHHWIDLSVNGAGSRLAPVKETEFRYFFVAPGVYGRAQ